MQKVIKLCGITIIIFLLALIVWYFFSFAFFKNIRVQGTAAPVLSKEEARDLMNYHGVKVIQVKNGEWTFERDGETISLLRPVQD